MKRTLKKIGVMGLIAYLILFVALRALHVLYHQLWWNGSSSYKSVMHYHQICPNADIGGSQYAYVLFWPLCRLESAGYNLRDYKYRKGQKITDYIDGKKQIPKQWYENSGD
jgi:hypothetical protein